MHSMNRVKILTGFFLLLLLSSCGKYKEIEVGDIQEFSIKGFVDNSLVLAIRVPVYNPSMYKITLMDLDARVYINDEYIGKVNSTEPVVLPRKSNDVHDLVVNVRLANFLGSAMKMMNLRKGSNVKLRLEGTFTAKSLGLKKKVEVDETRDVVI